MNSRWTKLNRHIFTQVIRFLRKAYVINQTGKWPIGKTKAGATHKVRASGLGGWTRKMNRARA